MVHSLRFLESSHKDCISTFAITKPDIFNDRSGHFVLVATSLNITDEMLGQQPKIEFLQQDV